MNLRKANKDDLERVVEIYNSSIEWRLSTADTVPVSVESKKRWFDAHTDERPLLILERADKILGWVSIEPYHERPAYKNTVIVSIYIDHGHIGKGIGKEMLSEALELMPSLGVRSVIAIIYSHNGASIKLFKNFGFEEWGKLPDVCEMDGKLYSVTILGLHVSST